MQSKEYLITSLAGTNMIFIFNTFALKVQSHL